MMKIGEELYLGAVKVGYTFRKVSVIARYMVFHKQTLIQNNYKILVRLPNRW
jgi:hypothetical protein